MVSSNGADEAALQRSYSVAPPIDAATAERLVKEAKQIMDQLGVAFFLRQGTCLGAIRDKGFMPWDDDVDLGSIIGLHGLTEPTIETVASAFRDNGYFVKVEHNDYCINVAMMKSSTRIDWASYRIIDDSIVHYPGVLDARQAFYFDSRKSILLARSSLSPIPPEEYLRFKYGARVDDPKETSAGMRKTFYR